MKVLIISKSFIVREAISVFFSKNFKEYKIEVLRNLRELSNIELKNIELAFIDMNEDMMESVNLIKNSFNDMKVIVFNKNNDKNIFIKCLNSKIESCIFDIDEEEELSYIIKRVIKGKKYYDIELLDEIISQKESVNEILFESLTQRELEVLHMVGLGYTNKEIAKKLYISEHTIKKHITSILYKLDMKNRKDLIIYTKGKFDKDTKFKSIV